MLSRASALWLCTLVLSLPVSAAPSRFVNLSVRNFVGEGDGVLILGFNVAGNGARPILLRSVGPTLAAAPFNVSGTLADPRVQVYTGQGTLVVENQDWGGDSTLSAAFSTVGAFALPSISRDAAAMRSFSAGGYTCVSSSQTAGGTGEALLELYDVPGSGGANTLLSNLSVRGTVRAGGTLITGFVISGDAPKRVLLRAVGPSLDAFGVGSAHANPKLTLYRDGTTVATNDDWSAASNAAEVASTSQKLGAFALSSGSADAALLVTLPPGGYTAHVNASDSKLGGVVLVELYDGDDPSSQGYDPAAPAIAIRAVSADPLEGANGLFRIERQGGDGRAVSVALSYGGTAGNGSDYTGAPSTVVLPAGVPSVEFAVQTLADGREEATESIECSVAPGSGYEPALGQATSGLLVRDATARSTGWAAEYFANAKLEGAPAVKRIDADIDFDWADSSPAPAIPVDNFSARWTGSVFAETTGEYTFVAHADDKVWVWVDDVPVIARPKYAYDPTLASITLAGGAWHNVRVEFAESGGKAHMHLGWYGPGMTMRILGGATVAQSTNVPASVGGPWDIKTVAGAPFQLDLLQSGAAGSIQVSTLPAGLFYDAAKKRVSGNVLSAGVQEFIVSASNAAGAGSTRVRIDALATERQASSDRWLSAVGGQPAIPRQTAAASGTVSSLASAGGAPGAFVRRIQGVITVPATGLYTFWAKGSGRTEFWLADSDEPGDRTLRCTANTNASWEANTAQRSLPVSLVAGQQCYFELRQAGDSASDDNAALAWAPPWAEASKPLEVVPAYALSRYTHQVSSASGRLVLVGALRPPKNVSTVGYGTVSVSLDEAANSARVTARIAGLGSPITAARLLLDPGTINETRLYNLSSSLDATSEWSITSAGGRSVADIVAALKAGNVAIRVETARFPAGELEGNLLSSVGSAEFTPPPAPDPLPSGPPSDAEAARFLTQASMGPDAASIARVKAIGYAAWIDEQWRQPASGFQAYVDAARAALKAKDPTPDVWDDTFVKGFFKYAVKGQDQLRQRVAFAMSQIFVISLDSDLHLDACATYYDMLMRRADGNYRDLLKDMTLSPAMGRYLSMLKNRKPDPTRGVYPDENYAREVMQLFSIGLNRLNPDGTLVLDSSGLPIPTYSQEAIVGLARVFTGWSYKANKVDYSFYWGDPDYRNPMQLYPEHHDTGPKHLLDGRVLPGNTDGAAEMTIALDMLFNHPNAGPFISRQLIQRLVTSNPSPAYVYRVAQVFANNGSGVRGDLKAVIRAILLDPEARTKPDAADKTRGKYREPVLRLTQLWRAMKAEATSGEYNFAWFRDKLGQEPLRSPTVFNFYLPSYAPSGGVSSAGLVAPEAQITTETQVAEMANHFEWFCSGWGEDQPDKIKLDLTAARAALTTSQDALLDHFSLLFFANDMPASLREKLKTMLGTFPSWMKTDDRIRSVLYTLLCSPDFVIER